jgi:UDPglucose 6-dehydrogenase
MNIACVGSGYVGLVTGTCLAEIGHTVICADIDEAKIAKLKKGVMPIYELGLEELVNKNVREGRLSFTTNVGQAIEKSEVIFNGVGTPEDPKTGRANLQYVFAVAETFAEHLTEYKILVNKSTVPVGTADAVRERIIKVRKKMKAPEISFDVVSNPEFLREGAAIKDFLNPDRVVIGAPSVEAQSRMEKVYRPIARAGRPVMFTSVRSAELIKYASNAFLATKISFINEVANFCEKVGANVKEVAKGMGSDTRIGSRFLHAGIGYGGSCFPKDVQALIQTGKDMGHNFSILEAVDSINDRQKMRPVEILKEEWQGKLKGKTVAIWGLSFKPRTDDVREAPALYIIKELLLAGVSVRVFDPVAMEDFKKTLQSKKQPVYCKNALDAAKGADALLVVTEWDEFRSIDPHVIQKTLKGNLIVDGRNIYEAEEVEEVGLKYRGIGI